MKNVKMLLIIGLTASLLLLTLGFAYAQSPTCYVASYAQESPPYIPCLNSNGITDGPCDGNSGKRCGWRLDESNSSVCDCNLPSTPTPTPTPTPYTSLTDHCLNNSSNLYNCQSCCERAVFSPYQEEIPACKAACLARYLPSSTPTPTPTPYTSLTDRCLNNSSNLYNCQSCCEQAVFSPYQEEIPACKAACLARYLPSSTPSPE